MHAASAPQICDPVEALADEAEVLAFAALDTVTAAFVVVEPNVVEELVEAA